MHSRSFPISNLKLAASERSTAHLAFGSRDAAVEAVSARSFDNVDLFSPLPAALLLIMGSQAVQPGVVIGQFSAFRMDANVP